LLSDLLFWFVGAPAWAVGGAFSARQAVAVAERHYLRLAHEAWEEDQRNRPQDKMDSDDWIGASVFAGLAFVAFPAVAVYWVIKRLCRPFKRPAQAFFTPPIQKAHEQHVERLDAQKELIMSTARTYDTVKREWEPDDAEKTAMVHQLQETIKQQMSELMRMTNPNTPSGHDTDYLDRVKFEVKELTA
jgi:hypothetical protein